MCWKLINVHFLSAARCNNYHFLKKRVANWNANWNDCWHLRVGGGGVGGEIFFAVERHEVIFILASSVVRYRRRRRVNHISRT